MVDIEHTRRTQLEEFPEWREGQKTLVSLQLHEAELDRQIDEIARAVTQHAAQRTNPIAAAAEKLLATGELPDMLELERLRRDLGALMTRRRVVREAIRSHRDRIEMLRSRIADEVREALDPEHAALVQKVAEAVIALGHACAAERDFRDEVRDGGFGSTIFRPMAFYTAGDPRDSESRAAKYLLEAIEFGFVTDISLIPEEWRESWEGAAEMARRAAGENGFAPPLPAPAAQKLRRVKLTNSSADESGFYGPGRIIAVPEDAARKLLAERQATPLDFQRAEAAD